MWLNSTRHKSITKFEEQRIIFSPLYMMYFWHIIWYSVKVFSSMKHETAKFASLNIFQLRTKETRTERQSQRRARSGFFEAKRLFYVWIYALQVRAHLSAKSLLGRQTTFWEQFLVAHHRHWSTHTRHSFLWQL